MEFMSEYYNKILIDLQDEIDEVSCQDINKLVLYERIINLTLKKISDLKKYVLEKGFENEKAEIYFFKYQKPNIIAKLIYYNAIYKIETKKPYGSKAIKKYLNEELKKLKRFFDNNLEFYKYYRTNNSFIDNKLFLRGKYDIKLSLDTVYFESDHRFSTSHDYKAAKIMANDLIQLYLEEQLHDPIYKNKSTDLPLLNWTASKTALIELIYSFHAHGVFNNGNADIKLIARTFEETFNIDLGDFYHTFMELKSRKINRTKFLDCLRDELIKKMNEEDEM